MIHTKYFPYFFSFVIFLCFQLYVFNIGIDFRDEGFLTYNAIRINNGEIPYKDFFLTTTPGTFYIQALMMKIFGNYIITARILYIIIILSILFVISRIFQSKPFIILLLLYQTQNN